MPSRFFTADRAFKWIWAVLALAFVAGIAYGWGVSAARTQCVVEGQFHHNDQVYRCERLR